MKFYYVICLFASYFVVACVRSAAEILFRFTPDRLDPAKVYDAGGRGRPQTNAEL